MAGDHRCEVCGATFTRPQHVGRHMRSHTGDKPYACPHCPDRFARRHVNKTHCPPDPNGSWPVQKKKRAKENSQINPGQNDGGLSSSRNDHLSSTGGLWAIDTSKDAGQNKEISSSLPPLHYQVPKSMTHAAASNAYHSLPNSQHLQPFQPQPMSNAWPVSLGEGDVIERLAAVTGDLDGEESEDEEVWARANGSAGLYQASTGFQITPTIQQMASMQLHQTPSAEMAMHLNQAYPPQLQSQSGMLPAPYQHQPVFYSNSVPVATHATDGMVQPDQLDIFPSAQRNISFGSFYHPFSPGLMSAPPITASNDWAANSQSVSHLHSSPIATGSSPMTNGLSPTWDDRSSGARHSNSPASAGSNSFGLTEAVASTSPALDPAKQSTSPFGDGYSSSMPTVDEDSRLNNAPVFINRPFKKRACEQCNASKVRCDSQLPCQKCTMRGIRCTYPVGKKLGRKSGSSHPPAATEGKPNREPQPWMYMAPGPAHDAMQLYGNAPDRQAGIQFGSVSSAVPDAVDQAAIDAKLRESFSSGTGEHDVGVERVQFRERAADDDGFSITSGYASSLAQEQSRRGSMADSFVGAEEQMDGDFLRFNDMGIASAASQTGSWRQPENVLTNGMPPTMSGRPGFPLFQIDGKVTNRAPSLSDVKDAWRQFASGRQSVSIGGLIPPQQMRPKFIHRNRSNSVPDIFSKHFSEMPSTLNSATPKAEVNGSLYGSSTQVAASPVSGTLNSVRQSASPADLIDTASQGEYAQVTQIARGNSGHSSISIVDSILPLTQDGITQDTLDSLDSHEVASQVRLKPSIARPSIAVFQPTTEQSSVARHILQKGGSQTLAPERPPSFLNTSFLDNDRNKFKVPGVAGGVTSQPIASSVKMSSLAARPGNKRLPSQTLGPDYQKKIPIAAEPSPLANMVLSSPYTPTDNGSRRHSVPNWIGGTVYPGNVSFASMSSDFVDSESSFLQAAFPGTMTVPEFTPTPNNLGGFPFPVPSYT